MAKAERVIWEESAPPPPPIRKEGVKLTLSLAEACTLKAIMMRIAGDPKNSRRKHADSIAEALGKAGTISICPSVKGTITCENQAMED